MAAPPIRVDVTMATVEQSLPRDPATPAAGRVLVVDDDLRLRRILSMFLSLEGFDVVTVANGEDALREVEDRPPDVVVMDVMMPGIDGLEVCRRMRGDSKPAVPVVMFTALSGDREAERARTAGANHLITKPFNLLGLADLVGSFCAARSPAPA